MIHLKQAGKATGTFYFKQFKVEDGQSTMKVGTDAVLLGAAVDVRESAKILEIGTGSGVIALILGQRSQAMIDAIEIDENSADQAQKNVINSPWKDRIKIFHSSLQEFIKQSDKKYDLVVTNPPYFSRSLKSPDHRRNISRHNDTLSFDELITGSLGIMQPEASLWVILPVKETNEFTCIASTHGLFPIYLIKIYNRPSGCHQRNIIQLNTRSETQVKEDIISIRTDAGDYSREYMYLTKEYYLDF